MSNKVIKKQTLTISWLTLSQVLGGITMVLAQSIPPRFQGTWVENLKNCALPMDDTRLVLSDGWVDFHESRGKITAVTVDDELNLRVTAKLAGEGETWKDTFHFRLSENHQKLTSIHEDGISFTRHRCP
ncbi:MULTISPECIES: hypothetical protein [unclassified Synechocystis]|nr:MULTISPECIES: hypothetical protein [unclassified Synechocystis]UOO11052.1 hypothetical protein MT986_13250 [Synechocystis sp. PCC 6803]